MSVMNLWEKRKVPRPPEFTIEYSLEELAQNNMGELILISYSIAEKGCQVFI